MDGQVAECEYKEYNRALAEYFIHGLGDEDMINEILREVSAFEDTDDATSKRVLLWPQSMEAHKVQKDALYNIQEAKDIDTVRHSI